jgi:branched-chain amino acid transport system permease protein
MDGSSVADVRRWAFSLAPAVAIVAVQQVLFPLSMGLFVHGALVGGLTALVALGMAMTYRSNRILNFAQAELGFLPVVLMAMLTTVWGWNWAVAAVISVLAAILLGAIVELAVIRRFAKAPRLLLMVATIGLSQVLGALGIILPRLFGRETFEDVSVPPPFVVRWRIGTFVFGTEALLAIIVIPIAAIALGLLMRRSSIGLAVRAAADSAARAVSLGVPVKRLQTVVWAVAGFLSFVAIYLRSGMLPGTAGSALTFAVLLRALAALLIGRLTDLTTIVSTAIALGVLEIGVGQNAESADVINPVLAVVIAVALLLGHRSKSTSRVDITEATSWQAAEDVRPIPTALARLPVVRLARWGGLALFSAAVLVLPHLLSIDRVYKATALMGFAVLGLSIVVLTGWSGQVSLGQMGFFAIGATVGAKATVDWGIDLSLALVLTGALGALAAVAVGLPALRLQGIYLAVTTMAFALAMNLYVLNPRFDIASWVPQGRVPRPPLLGQLDIDGETTFYYVALAVLVVLLLGLRGIRHSRTGRAMIAMRDNEAGAQAYSLDPTRIRLTAFALSGAIAAVAGCLTVHTSRGLGDQLFNPYNNLAVFSTAVVGGIASPFGAVLGALYIQGSRWFLPVQWQLLASGFGILLVLLIAPGGLGGIALRLRDRWLRSVASSRGLDVAGVAVTRFSDAAPDADASPVTDAAAAVVEGTDVDDTDPSDPSPVTAGSPS